MPAHVDKDLRIGIIGAGPAGLGSAEALKEKGYRNVVVLEKRGRAGGQALSLRYRASGREIVYELGSLQPISARVGAFGRLLKRHGMRTGKPLTKEMSGDAPLLTRLYSYEERRVVVDYTKSIVGYPYAQALPIVADMAKLAYCLFKYRYLADPGFAHIPGKDLEELSVPLLDWIDARRFRVIGRELKLVAGSMLTFTNPERAPDIPALKLLKMLLYLVKLPPRYINGQVKLMREGYQELWNKVARGHDVRFNAKIGKITRGADAIKVEVDGEVLTFDRLIVTCAADEVAKILDVTEEERSVFAKVRFCPGWRVAFLARGMPHDAVYSTYEPFLSRDYPIRLHAFVPEGQVDDQTWLFSSIIASPSGESLDALKANAAAAIGEHFHGEVVEWLHAAYWPEYSPHFARAEVKAGIYEKLEALSGPHDTYFFGGLVSGATHPIVVNYVYDRIARYF